MGRSAEAWQEQQSNTDDMECTYAHEEQSFYAAVNEVKSFIERGDVSFEQVERILRGDDNVGH